MFKGKALKIIGLIATVVGAGASVVSSIVSDKKTDETIAKKVAEAIAEKQ